LNLLRFAPESTRCRIGRGRSARRRRVSLGATERRRHGCALPHHAALFCELAWLSSRDRLAEGWALLALVGGAIDEGVDGLEPQGPQATLVAAENFAFQDFPIILASFGLSNAECDRKRTMANWVFKGLRTGIKTTAYPVHQDDAPGVSPGRPRASLLDSAAAVDRLIELCPTQAIERQDGGVAIDHATAALIPPFFMLDLQRRENIAPKFLTEFHDLGAQVGQSMLPGRALVVLHRGGEENPVVFAMSTSYMLIALAGILAFSFVVFGLLSRRASRAKRGLGRRAAPTVADNDLYRVRILQSRTRHIRQHS
jgi:hypothetical protein